MSQADRDARTGGRGRAALIGGLQLGLVVAVLVGAVALNRVLVALTATESPDPIAAKPPLVEIITPEAARQTLRVTETGTVQARTEIGISPQVGGRIVSVAPDFAAGGSFKAGEVVFTIEPDDFRLRLQRAQADLETAKSALALEEAEAESAIREWRLINPDEPVPPLVARTPQLTQARASVAVAQAAVDEAQLNLSRTEFTFPFAGRVLTTTIEPGLTVAANQNYGSVYSGDALEARVSVSPDDLGRLAPVTGRRATVRGRAGGTGVSADARVRRMESALDSRSRLAGLVLAFDDPPPFLPGSFIEATILGPEIEDVFVLPPDTVSAAGNVWTVADRRLVRKTANIRMRTEERVLVSAFDYGQGIVTVPPAGAREGQEVRFGGEITAPGVSTAQAEG